MILLRPLCFFILATLSLACRAEGSLIFKAPFPTTPSAFNMTISDTHQFVWFRVAKVGTRTILKVLRDHQVPFAINGNRIPFVPVDYAKHFKFAFVRNPWDRVVSCYFDKVVNKALRSLSQCYDKDFDFFVDFIDKHNLAKCDVHIKLQSKLFPLDEVDFIGRMENITQDLKYVCRRIGINCSSIPQKNVSEHEHYSKYYTARTKAIIARKYRADIKAFGYKFETK